MNFCPQWLKIGLVTFVCRKIPVLGKHTKKIKCGCWSKENLLALASDDHTLSVSNSDGDTVKQFSVLGDPSDVQFSEMKADERSNFGENTVSSSSSSSCSSSTMNYSCSRRGNSIVSISGIATMTAVCHHVWIVCLPTR